MIYRVQLVDYFCQRDRGWFFLLFGAVCVVYLPFLGNPFFFDDLTFFANGAVAAYGNTSFDLTLRGLPYTTLGWIDKVFSSEFPHIYHLASLLLHAVNTVLLFYLLRNLLDAVQAKSGTPVRVSVAWFGAVVFALHPVVVFAVGYAIQFSILMATMFGLLMQLAYLRGLLSGKKRWFALAVLAYFMACFSKEHSVLMPAIVGSMGLLVPVARSINWRMLVPTWLAFIAIAVLVTLRARGVLGAAYEPMAAQLFEQQGIDAGTPMLHLLSAMTQAGLFFKYLLLWLLPDPSLMSIDMRESFIISALDGRAWIGVIAFVLYGVFGISLLLRGGVRGLAGFAMLYPWLLFWVELVGIRMQEPFVLYRSYLWMPGMMLFFPMLLAKLSERKTWLVMICLVVVLVPLSWERLWVFADHYRLWNEAAVLLKNESVAGADRIFYNRGLAEMDIKNWEDAAVDFKRSADISPQLEPIRYELGLAYANSGRESDALAQFDAAIAMKPTDDRVYFVKGMLLKRMHRDAEAMKLIEQSCRLKNRVACLIAGNFKRQEN